MIHAVFERKNGRLCSVCMSGHAGYADAGEDIVCAAASSAVQLAANLITDSFQEQAEVSAEDAVTIRLKTLSGNGSTVLEGLCTHLRYVSEDYPGTIKIEITEV